MAYKGKNKGKYIHIYESLISEGYEPLTVIVWQRNRWRINVIRQGKIYKLYMTDQTKSHNLFHELIKKFMESRKSIS